MYRYELKFVLEEHQLPQFLSSSLQGSFYRAYPNRLVTSLYLDTVAMHTAFDNIAGIGYREKYRIRWYDNNEETTAETKIKDGRVGTKRTTKTQLTSSDLLSWPDAKLEREISKSEQCQSVFKRFDLQPTVFVRYKREYFTTTYGLRMTIDQDLCFMNPERSRPEKSCFVRSPGVVVEFKFDPSVAELCRETLYKASLLPTKNSKYIRGLSAFDKAVYF